MSGDSHNRDSSIGRGMIWLAAIGMLLGLTMIFQTTGPGRGGVTQSFDESGRVMVVVKRDRSGHYLARGAINGQAVDFLVDTGATDVALSESLARSLGLEFGPEIVVMTAGGPAGAWMTRLDKVSVGSLSLSNVRATITPALSDEVLLGMSFLQHFNLTQEGEELIIAQSGQP